MINYQINTLKVIAIGIHGKREKFLQAGMVMEDFIERTCLKHG